MTNRRQPRDVETVAEKRSLSRRDLLQGGVTLGAVGTLLSGCGSPKAVPEPLSEAALTAASELSGEPLSPQRIKAMRSSLDFNSKHLRVLRDFDPDEQDPLTMFRV